MELVSEMASESLVVQVISGKPTLQKLAKGGESIGGDVLNLQRQFLTVVILFVQIRVGARNKRLRFERS